MNKRFVKDVSKVIDSTQVGELSPGSTERRYEPEGGIRKHNERIHRESKQFDNHGNLPFTFSKPKKLSSSKYVECSNCGHIARVQKATVGMICSECKTYSSVKEVSI